MQSWWEFGQLFLKYTIIGFKIIFIIGFSNGWVSLIAMVIKGILNYTRILNLKTSVKILSQSSTWFCSILDLICMVHVFMYTKHAFSGEVVQITFHFFRLHFTKSSTYAFMILCINANVMTPKALKSLSFEVWNCFVINLFIIFFKI